MPLISSSTTSACSSSLLTHCAGGHIVHVSSALGQLEGIPLDGVKAYIRGAKSVQELVNMPYPAEELAKVPVKPRVMISVVSAHCVPLADRAVSTSLTMHSSSPDRDTQASAHFGAAAAAHTSARGRSIEPSWRTHECAVNHEADVASPSIRT